MTGMARNKHKRAGGKAAVYLQNILEVTRKTSPERMKQQVRSAEPVGHSGTVPSRESSSLGRSSTLLGMPGPQF